VKDWAADGVKPFIYINPFFQNVSGKSFARSN
jgi:hypothetical protein